MKPVRVDFRTRRGPPWWAWAVAAVPFVAAGVLGLQAIAAWRDSQRVEEESRRAVLQAEQLRVRLAAEPAFANSVREYLRQAAIDWPSALRAIEQARNERIRVRAIEIVPADRKVTVEVDYVDARALGELVEDLNAGHSSPRWMVIKLSGPAGTSLNGGSAVLTGELD